MLILVEGTPGAGKSSTARWLRDVLVTHERPVRWWFEEELGHPVHLFQDDDGLRQCVADLRDGQFEAVISAALDRWRHFADGLAGSDTAVILDGCLSIYLTYTLFFFDVPEARIAAYVEEVARIIAPCAPRLILLRPPDLARSLAAVCDVRGDTWARPQIETIAASPRGRRIGLGGFDGLVAFWAAHREMTDRLFAALPIPTVVVPGPVEDAPATRAAISDVLSIDPASAASTDAPDIDLQRFVGRYVEQSAEADAATCAVTCDADVLIVVGLPGFGARCRLVRRGPLTFGFEGVPLRGSLSRRCPRSCIVDDDRGHRPAVPALGGTPSLPPRGRHPCECCHSAVTYSPATQPAVPLGVLTFFQVWPSALTSSLTIVNFVPSGTTVRRLPARLGLSRRLTPVPPVLATVTVCPDAADAGCASAGASSPAPRGGVAALTAGLFGLVWAVYSLKADQAGRGE
jgi:hypothetical protein